VHARGILDVYRLVGSRARPKISTRRHPKRKLRQGRDIVGSVKLSNLRGRITAECAKGTQVSSPLTTYHADGVRCIPKMDHHCPWTVNCVSHFTFPYFMRFLWYAVLSMCYLEYFLYLRAGAIWESRNMPSVSRSSLPMTRN
jgi:hypothetical protein